MLALTKYYDSRLSPCCLCSCFGFFLCEACGVFCKSFRVTFADQLCSGLKVFCDIATAWAVAVKAQTGRLASGSWRESSCRQTGSPGLAAVAAWEGCQSLMGKIHLWTSVGKQVLGDRIRSMREPLRLNHESQSVVQLGGEPCALVVSQRC